jgi:hypothetical protein
MPLKKLIQKQVYKGICPLYEVEKNIFRNNFLKGNFY